MTTRQLKHSYFQFFQRRGHAVIRSASLIPENDPSILFTTAGMHPLVPYLMGEKHPEGARLASVQKCIRTGDIEEVGDGTHLTFFEMLGNWSLGEYWKKEAIEWSFEFLTQELGIPVEKLAVSVFAGDDDAPRDEESAAVWKELGIPDDRIAYLGKDDNWWPAGGKEKGPQGPDTEMFYWTGDEKPPHAFDPNDERWFEIWNDVFMEYERTADGELIPLKQRNVDTGMGVERTVAALEGKTSVHDIDTVQPLIELIRRGIAADTLHMPSARIIVDHVRAATFLLADERQVRPSNVDQGYILRRLIRRAIRHARMIGFSLDTMPELIQQTIHEYHADYPELARNREVILDEFKKEQDKFLKTLDQGERVFNTLAASSTISAGDAFRLFASYGFPLEMTEELARERGIRVDARGFAELFRQHQEQSRTASAGKFKGGLADHDPKTIRYHTANHIMLEAMKRVLGRDVVNQKGSNITSKRLRFDFTYPEKLTTEQIGDIERIANEEIAKNHEVRFEEMSVDEAKKIGATGVFDHKYGNMVKVYFVGDFSKEICGGPHVKNTGEIGILKISKEEASSAGVRRIRAILE